MEIVLHAFVACSAAPSSSAAIKEFYEKIKCTVNSGNVGLQRENPAALAATIIVEMLPFVLFLVEEFSLCRSSVLCLYNSSSCTGKLFIIFCFEVDPMNKFENYLPA